MMLQFTLFHGEHMLKNHFGRNIVHSYKRPFTVCFQKMVQLMNFKTEK